jgi:hypothetical protein
MNRRHLAPLILQMTAFIIRVHPFPRFYSYDTGTDKKNAETCQIQFDNTMLRLESTKIQFYNTMLHLESTTIWVFASNHGCTTK